MLLGNQCPVPITNEPQNYSPRINDGADMNPGSATCMLQSCSVMLHHAAWAGAERGAEPGQRASAKSSQNAVTPDPSSLPRSPGASLQSVQVCNDVSGGRAPFIM